VLGEPVEITFKVVNVFQKLDIDYLIGGSLASSLYGIPRSTQDVDLVANIKLNHVSDLVILLQGSS